ENLKRDGKQSPTQGVPKPEPGNESQGRGEPSGKGLPSMYKVLLCLRYLKTRYIALASIISVMLGVATMVVVNSVMAGFSTEMRDRLHGILADVVVETINYDGAPDADRLMATVKEAAGDYVDGMTATVEVFGILHFQYGGQWVPRPVTIIGIKPEGKA